MLSFIIGMSCHLIARRLQQLQAIMHIQYYFNFFSVQRKTEQMSSFMKLCDQTRAVNDAVAFK